ncbi:MAG: hypothetical protein LDLANPLL_01122 [Turneriella sp.]|nr:hypothetical protein [Turneriella sp.]
MLKRVFLLLCVSAATAFTLNCGKSYCKQYTEKLCKDVNSAECKAAQEKVKSWSSNQCRIEFNNLVIEEQEKKMEKILEE